MQDSFASAVTSCPSCKQDVLLTDEHCSHCGSSADKTSSFVSFRRPDGSGGIVDQITIAYLRSKQSEPVQSDLDELFAKVTRVELMDMVFEGGIGRFQPRLGFATCDDLSALQQYLTINAT